jgi:hypothetical protein
VPIKDQDEIKSSSSSWAPKHKKTPITRIQMPPKTNKIIESNYSSAIKSLK